MSGPDRRTVSRAFERVAGGYAAADFLHREIRARLLQRLSLITLKPATALDLGAGPPAATADLAARLPDARLLALDLVPAMLGPKPQPWERICADAGRLPLADAAVDLVSASMLLHWCEDAPAVMAEVRRVLRYPGLFLFSTLGPDTLRELRNAWPREDRRGATLHFADMHTLGDALIHAGFAEPVVDTETLTITYPDIHALVSDLRAVGAGNLAPGRRRTLTGRARWMAMTGTLEKFRDAGGRLPVTIEVIYGQAWSGSGSDNRLAPGGEVTVPLAKLQRRNAGAG